MKAGYLNKGEKPIHQVRDTHVENGLGTVAKITRVGESGKGSKVDDELDKATMGKESSGY